MSASLTKTKLAICRRESRFFEGACSVLSGLKDFQTYHSVGQFLVNFVNTCHKFSCIQRT